MYKDKNLIAKFCAGFVQEVGRSFIFFVVGARGFEPPTSCSQSRRATRLRYAPFLLAKRLI